MIQPIGVLELVIVFSIFLGISVIPVLLFWKVLRKAGLQPQLALIAVLPFFGPLILLFLLATLDWPASRASPSDAL